MKLHLVGGFLGSGKTTGIVRACKQLSASGIDTAIITNDQGQVLVDSKFVQSLHIAHAEVTGGCFCCNYNDLMAGIDHLKKTNNPVLIFAESVGSCTDLVATVLKPILKFRNDIEQITFSTFVDSRLLYTHMLGLTLPFDSSTSYIWEKQLEEAEILVVNKMDLVNEKVAHFFHENVQKHFPLKHILFQNSRDISSVEKWIDVLDSIQQNNDRTSIEIDYNIYGQGEANLAWLDEEIEILTTDNTALQVAQKLMNMLVQAIDERKLPIGHLKFLTTYDGESHSTSYTTILDKSESHDSDETVDTVRLVLNARVQTTPEILHSILQQVVGNLGSLKSTIINEKNLSLFKPGFPIPSHRIGLINTAFSR